MSFQRNKATMIICRARLGLLFLLGSALAGAVPAGAGSISDTIFRIDASNNAGSGYLEFYADEPTYDAFTNTWVWTKGLTQIVDPHTGALIAVLDSASLRIARDPLPVQPYRMDLGFMLHAGASQTLFTIQSAQLTFTTPLPPGMLQAPNGGGRASAALSVVDENGDGAELQATGPVGAGAYAADYNGWFPAGTVFVSFVNAVSVGPGGRGSASQNFPSGVGRASIDTTITDLSAGLSFTLTAQDSVTAATQYTILPVNPGDLNCDGAVRFGDIDPFILALLNPARYRAAFPDCNILNADINNDGFVTFGDIDPFIALLTG